MNVGDYDPASALCYALELPMCAVVVDGWTCTRAVTHRGAEYPGARAHVAGDLRFTARAVWTGAHQEGSRT